VLREVTICVRIGLILTLLGAASCGNLNQKFFSEDLATITTFQVAGHRAFLLVPKSQHAQDQGPWIWYAPTFIHKDTPGQVNRYIFDALLKNGIQVAGVDVGESYGGPEGTKVYSSFYQLVVEKYRLSSKPCLFAQSRGGLMLYNWAEEHADSVLCIAAIFPVTDLRTWPLSKDSPQQYDQARDAYGMKGRDEEFRKRLEEFSPVSHLSSLAQYKVPIFHIHGDSDYWVPLSNSCSLAKRYAALGGDAKVQVIKGKGHESADEFFKSCDLLEFFLSHLVHQSASAAPHCPQIDMGTCPQ
jgi:Prolyl oligopeptidase family